MSNPSESAPRPEDRIADARPASAVSDPSRSAPDRPFVIVLGIDLADQESSGFAFDQAMRIASRIDRSEMHAVYVVSKSEDDEKVDGIADLLKLYVSEKAAALAMRGPRRAGVHVRRGDPAREIGQMAADLGADMVVVGTRKTLHVSKIWVGSTAERVMTSTACPVFVAGPRPKPRPSHTIVIEPSCDDCIRKRLATQGASWWCDRHSEPHSLRRHHVYSYRTEFPFALHDSEVTPTGTD